jgi:hypothetical protein
MLVNDIIYNKKCNKEMVYGILSGRNEMITSGESRIIGNQIVDNTAKSMVQLKSHIWLARKLIIQLSTNNRAVGVASTVKSIRNLRIGAKSMPYNLMRWISIINLRVTTGWRPCFCLRRFRARWPVAIRFPYCPLSIRGAFVGSTS